VIVCATTSPSIDKLFVVDRLRAGQVHRPLELVRVAGGKALNCARAARQLGGDVFVVATVCGAAGQWIGDELEREGIPAQLVPGDGETRSSLTVSDAAAGTLTEFYEPAPPISPRVWARFVATALEHVRDGGWLSLSGSLAPGAPVDGIAHLIEGAHARGARVAVDTHGPGLPAALATSPELVKVNAAEAAELLGCEAPESGESLLAWALEAAHSIRSRAGSRNPVVAVTCGVDGIVLVDVDGGQWRGSLDVRGRFPVASGDAVLGAMLTTMNEAGAEPQALAVAVGAAAANAETAGAGRFMGARARKLAERALIAQV
jgi:1-phosphofructokinase family hexose kinase